MFRTLLNVTKFLSVVLFASGALFAVPTLFLADSATGDFVFIYDNTAAAGPNTASDSAAGTAGKVLFVGNVGTWGLNIVTGTTKPNLGTATKPELLLSGDVTSTFAGSSTLTVQFTEINYVGLPNQYGVMTGTLNSASGGLAVSDFFYSQLDPGNLPFVGAVYNTVGPLTTIPSSGVNKGLTPLPLGNYSITLTAFVTHSAAGSSAFALGFQAVPEPGFYGVLALGLSGLFFVTYRKRAQSKS